jgi:hypothetical protein
MTQTMLTEDYLIRLIRLGTVAMARLMGLKAQLLYQDAMYLLNQTLEEVFGMRADLVRNLDDESLLDALTFQGNLDTDRLVLAADLLREDSDLQAAFKNPEESRYSLQRALNFYVVAALAGGPRLQADPADKITRLLGQVALDDLSESALFDLFNYHEMKGQYAQAESILDHLAAKTLQADEIRQERQDFYGRLLAKSDTILLQGGVERRDILAKLAQIGTDL